VASLLERIKKKTMRKEKKREKKRGAMSSIRQPAEGNEEDL